MPIVKPKLIVVVGPTASGKTALALEIAQQFSGEIISADSRQVYRGLDIGTEKITPAEMQDIPHHLLDVADVATTFTVTDFKEQAATAITAITDRGNLPIIAGGTFFYIDALLERIPTPAVPPDLELRAHLEEMSTDTLFATLERLDPERAFHIDKFNKRRLVRALEIVKSLGKVPAAIPPADPPYETLIIGIKTNKTELRQRIRVRGERALARGLIEETKTLLAHGVPKDRLLAIGLEYRLVIEYLDKQFDKAALLQKLEEKNWQYAKRQLTWLKRDESIEWYQRDDYQAIFARITDFIG